MHFFLNGDYAAAIGAMDRLAKLENAEDDLLVCSRHLLR